MLLCMQMNKRHKYRYIQNYHNILQYSHYMMNYM